MISLQRLEAFYWVATTQGYARAARAFPYPITQPGVHQAVRRLEEELGVTLFERVGKDRVHLTPHGSTLFAVVAPFYEQLPTLEARLKGGTPAGTLRVHAAAHVLRHLLPPWLRRLQDANSEVRVALSEVPFADLGALRRGEADVLVDWLPELPADLSTQPVAEVRAFIVAPSSGPYARPAPCRLAELKGLPFIGYGGDKTLRALQQKVLEANGLSPREAFAADSSETILSFVAAGLGFSLVPSILREGPKLGGVTAWQLERPRSVFAISAAWRKREVGAHPLIEAFLAHAPHVASAKEPAQRKG
jgi:DNA-binding transcriptional LysR family regulator